MPLKAVPHRIAPNRMPRTTWRAAFFCCIFRLSVDTRTATLALPKHKAIFQHHVTLHRRIGGGAFAHSPLTHRSICFLFHR